LYLQDTFKKYLIFYLQDTFKKYLAQHCKSRLNQQQSIAFQLTAELKNTYKGLWGSELVGLSQLVHNFNAAADALIGQRSIFYQWFITLLIHIDFSAEIILHYITLQIRQDFHLFGNERLRRTWFLWGAVVW